MTLPHTTPSCEKVLEDDEGWCVAFDKGVVDGERRAKERIREAYLAWCKCDDKDLLAIEDKLHEELGLGDDVERVKP